MRRVSPNPGFELGLDDHRPCTVTPTSLGQASFEVDFQVVPFHRVSSTAVAVKDDERTLVSHGVRSQEFLAPREASGVPFNMNENIRRNGAHA
jgi:hypothetical protein